MIYSTESPSPDRYDIKSVFEVSANQLRREKNKSFCFGTGREAFTKVVMPGKANIPDPCVPGPGSYENMRVISKDARKYSLGSRLAYNDIDRIEKKKAVPGPG